MEETKKIRTDPDNNIMGKFDDAQKLNQKSNVEAGKMIEGMNGDNKTGTSNKKSILDAKSDKVGEEMDRSSNSDEKETEEVKETLIKQKNDLGENEEVGKPKSTFSTSNQDQEELEELKEATTEEKKWEPIMRRQGNQRLIFHHQTKMVRTTISSPSNPDEDESEELKETAMEQENKMGAKNEEADKTELDFHNQNKMRRNQRS